MKVVDVYGEERLGGLETAKVKVKVGQHGRIKTYDMYNRNNRGWFLFHNDLNIDDKIVKYQMNRV